MSAELLLDNSAWARLDQDSLPQDRADEIADLRFSSVWLAARGSL
jgi:hypothetical protein